ncbi:tetratricopeptide repeat protein [Amycolatopsis pittospori]|uniref:tetratricopeptide repeat protein n=1 Tax=Amycolatopsis pittospori TaxID=2749434 RepID=UPI0015F0BE3F|nr:tetratricopeptide repeat protein [Amycolatopsis pittospori]
MQRERFLAEVTKARRACDYSAAAQLIRTYQSSHPLSSEPHVEAGHVAYDRGRLDLAAEYFDLALELGPSNDRALAWKVALKNVNEGPAAAILLAEELLASDLNLPAVRVALGRSRQFEGSKEEALAEYERALQIAPGYLDAIEWRIEVIGRLRGHSAALDELWLAVRRFPGAPELFVAAYTSAKGKQETARAQEILDQAIEVHPACVPPLRMKVDWLISTGQLEKAVDRADDALVLAPAAADLHVARGRARYEQGQFAAAIESFRRASVLEPHRAESVQWLVSALRVLERHEEVHREIEGALRRMPTNQVLLSVAADESGWRGDFDAALVLTGKAVQAAPANTSALLRHISALADRHCYEEAEHLALAAAREHPGNARLAAEVASVYGQLDRDEDALAWYRTAYSLDPKAFRISRIAMALGWLNRFAEAESLLLSSIEVQSDSVALFRRLGAIRELAGDFSGALEAYDKVIELDLINVPGHTAKIGLLCRLRRLEEAGIAARVAVDALPGNGNLCEMQTWPMRDAGRESDVEVMLRSALDRCENKWPIHLGILRCLRRQGRFEEALDDVAKMLIDDPHDLAAHRWMLDLLSDVRRYDEAIAYGERVTVLYPTNTSLRMRLGWLRQEIGDFAGALTDFESVCAMKRTIWAVRSMAKMLCQVRRFADAEVLLADEIRAKPNYAILRHELAWVYWMQAKEKEAIAECERARSIEFGPVDGIVNHALMLRRLNRWVEAEKVLTKALVRYPGNLLILTQFGLLNDDQNRYTAAIEWFDRALESDKFYSAALVAKSATLRSLGRFGEAEAMLEPALDRFPDMAELLIERGWIYRDQGRLSLAKQAFSKVADVVPIPAVRADARRCLGWTAFADDKYDEARDLFREVLLEDSYVIDAKIGLAWSLVRLDDLESDQAAEGLCLEVLGAEPRNHLAHTCLGVLFARQRDFPLAEHHLRYSLELDPFDGSFVDLAVLLVDLERFDEAEELLTKALDRNWYDIQAHIELGRLHLQRDIDNGEVGKNARSAGADFRRALTLDPTSPSAATGLAVTLSRLPGDLPEAERVMRRVISLTKQGDARWPLLLTLARLLIERGDSAQRPELYLEALALGQEAIDLANWDAEPYFVTGVAAFKAGSQNSDARLVSLYRRRSVRYLRRCLERDSRHEEARRVMTLAEQSVALAGGSLAGSRALSWITALLLIGLWTGFFLTEKISSVVLGTMTAVLASLFALGFVLPHLVRLKLPGGVEADLSASLAQVSAGPTGELNLGRGRFAGTSSHFDGGSYLNSGPRGELPRLGASQDEPLQ